MAAVMRTKYYLYWRRRQSLKMEGVSMDLSGFITLPTAAVRLKLAYSAAYDLVMKGEIEATQLYGRWFVREADVSVWIERRRAEQPLPAA